MGNKVRFDEIFDEDFIAKVHAAFAEHIKEEVHKENFIDKLRNRVISNSELQKALNSMAGHGITMTEKSLCAFLEQNCYAIVYPRLMKAGHSFNIHEKRHLVAYCIYNDSLCERDYPHESPDDQYKELCVLGNSSDDFISKLFETNMQGFCNDFEDEGLS